MLFGLALAAAGSLHLASDPIRAVRALTRLRVVMAGDTYLGVEGVVLQQTASDCGPAALATLLVRAGAARPPASIDAIAGLAGTTPRGTRLGGLARASTALGHPARSVRMRPDTLTAGALQAQLPAILWIDRRHFVTVSSRRADGRFVVLDPAVGAYTLTYASLTARWTGEAMLLQ